jgi:hypothetical protein
MTTPSPATLEREKDKAFVTDAEMMRRLGLNPKIARPVIAMLDAQKSKTGFPQKQPLWGGRRYMPAVWAWLDKTNGLIVEPSQRRQA